MPRQPVGCVQFTEGVMKAFSIDGSVVTTTAAKTGLLSGQHIATVKKGTGADSNLVTLRLNHPFGVAPDYMIQEITLDCVARVESLGIQTITIRTLQHDYSTKADDMDFIIFLFGTEGMREGSYG